MPGNNNVLVIGGGVGPAASVAFHKKIVDMTDNGRLGDQGHASVVHISMSQFIQDRTWYINDPTGDHPGVAMGQMVSNTCRAHSGMEGMFVTGVPCNTFHSPAVFDGFEEVLDKPQINVVNMIQSTAAYIKRSFAGKKIILLSTRGTRDTLVYDTYFKKNPEADDPNFLKCNGRDPRNDHNLEYYLKNKNPDVEKIAEFKQGAVMAAIYGKDLGIKSVTTDWKVNFLVFESVVEQIISEDGGPKEDYCVIMGCTEIPLAYGKAFERHDKTVLNEAAYIDPMDVLAANMINAAKFSVKDEFRKFLTPVLRSKL